ncbi:MAG: alcohol dehydrogenase catalytic domain-containing protein [Nitrospira sp.]|nr:alcohol dehydrogenase catalytic domain-containing protein [Nitrospira sp.]MDE0487369.1 alcohol dehydrogenase catalytic domain-containing protein [Nitrospira sp.]
MVSKRVNNTYPDYMRALTQRSGLEYCEQYPTPTPTDGEVLVRVIQAGICATDLQLVQGYMDFQGVLGHEFVGIVDETPHHPDLVGKRVVGEINAACRVCPACQAGRLTHCPHRTTLGIDRRDGAFADFLALPVENLYPLPDEITNDQAVFTEPLAAACQILEQVSIHEADRVLVIGDGKLGLLCAQVLHRTGCRLTVLGRHPEKLQILADRGIHTSQDPASLSPGFDIVVEATGTADGFKLACECVRPRGTIVLKSTYHGQTAVDMTALVIHEITVVGSRCGPFSQAIALLRENAIDVQSLIHKRFSIEEGTDAFTHAVTKGVLKVLLEMT